ncbi:hypothetical protein N0V85_002298 [Neurospora sp. IMI 360204]|nr:hypothetical protein N0V85_002298 [Neurospora sp. IMI 360204]
MAAHRYTIDELKEVQQPSMPALQMAIHTTQKEATKFTKHMPGKLTFKIPPGKPTTARVVDSSGSTPITPTQAAQPSSRNDIDICSEDDVDVQLTVTTKPAGQHGYTIFYSRRATTLQYGCSSQQSQNAQPANSTPFSVYDLKLVFTARSVMDDVRDVIVDLATDFFESFDNFELEVDAGLSSSAIAMLPRWPPPAASLLSRCHAAKFASSSPRFIQPGATNHL